MSRLGSEDFLGNLGPTFLLMALLVIVVITLSVILFYCARRQQLTSKIKSRIMDLKQKVFFNPLIRFVYLNYLKLNMGAMVGIFSAKATYKDILPSCAVIIVLNLIPIIFAYVLHKKRLNLAEESVVKSIGTIYQGQKVDSLEKPKVKQRNWIYPLVFCSRRTLFIWVCTGLFYHVNMQMVVHQLLTMLTIVYYMVQKGRFDTRDR